ncbi:MAG: iron-sulfur cluster repair protein YtfE (RIC family) [Planctomycetota bacterium]|jgi:iron-sulfur cluster repair protein YtfE (RIC family)
MVALFSTYQCGLMSLNLKEARIGLECLRYELVVHMQVEDSVLMPIYKGLEQHPEGGAPLFFEKEHAKLERLLDGLFSDVEGLERLDGVGELARADALLVIEHGFTFQHLFQHHSSREDKAFYPSISEGMTVAERQAIWRRMDIAEAGVRASLGRPPSMADITQE